MAGNDRAFELYFQVLAAWGTPEQLRGILKWATPEELTAILDAAGSPEEVVRVLKSSRSMAEREERLMWLFGIGSAVVKWLIWLGGAILLFQQVFPVLLEWFQK